MVFLVKIAEKSGINPKKCDFLRFFMQKLLTNQQKMIIFILTSF